MASKVARKIVHYKEQRCISYSTPANIHWTKIYNSNQKNNNKNNNYIVFNIYLNIFYLSYCDFTPVKARRNPRKPAQLCTTAYTSAHTYSRSHVCIIQMFGKKYFTLFLSQDGGGVRIYTPAIFQGAHWPCAIIWFWVILGTKNNYRRGIQSSKRLSGTSFALKECVCECLKCVCVCMPLLRCAAVGWG